MFRVLGDHAQVLICRDRKLESDVRLPVYLLKSPHAGKKLRLYNNVQGVDTYAEPTSRGGNCYGESNPTP